MLVLLVLAQIALAVLELLAHTIHISLWATFLPAMFIVAIWLMAQFVSCNININSFVHMMAPKPVRQRGYR